MLRATGLDAPRDSLALDAFASFPLGGPVSEGWYLGTLDLPTPGRWLVVAGIDTNWGCFIFTAR